MNNSKKNNTDRETSIMIMALNLDVISDDSKQGFRNHVNQYLTHIKTNPEDEYTDKVINEAIKLYNSGKKTPGVMIITDAINEYNNALYNLGYQNTSEGISNGSSRVRTTGHPVPLDDYNDSNTYGNAAFSSTLLIISMTLILGVLLGILIIYLK